MGCRRLHGVTGGSLRLQEETGCYKGLQRVPRGSRGHKGLQWVAMGCKGLQEVTGLCNCLQRVTRG